MPLFRYTAVDATSKTHSGQTEAASSYHLRQQLQAKDLWPLTITLVSPKFSEFWKRFYASPKLLALFTWELSNLVQAQLPLVTIFTHLASQSGYRRWRHCLLNSKQLLNEGYQLSQTLSEFPKIFPAYYTASIAAGEQSGRLAHVLQQLASYIQQQQMVRSKLQQALIYPLLVSAICIGVTLFLVTHVLPPMLSLFAEHQQNLPYLTRLFVHLNRAWQAYATWLMLGILILGSSIYYWIHYHAQFAWDDLKIKLPFVGNYLLRHHGTNYLRMLSLLLEAGVDLLSAMQTAKTLITNLAIRERLTQAMLPINQGIQLAQALQSTQIFPPLIIQLLLSAEHSQQLSVQLTRAATLLNHEWEYRQQIYLTLLEPLLILILGGIVLLVVSGILLPYSISIKYS